MILSAAKLPHPILAEVSTEYMQLRLLPFCFGLATLYSVHVDSRACVSRNGANPGLNTGSNPETTPLRCEEL